MHDDFSAQNATPAHDNHAGTAPVDIAFVRAGARELYAQGQDDFLAPATSQSAGMDLRACLDGPEAVIPAGGRLKVSTGISVQPRLAGIAGFILSIGMAVDANILIFERTWEEIKSGKNLAKSIDEGFRRAWPSIRDGNSSTILTCLILIWLGTGFVKGFALTLIIGVLFSLLTAIVITRTLLVLCMRGWVERYPMLFVPKRKRPDTSSL